MPKSHASVTLKRLTKRIHLQKGGPVAERTAQLLADRSLSLSAIADQVRRDIPTARTSDRSVASIAAALRKEGYDVPDRRSMNGRH